MTQRVAMTAKPMTAERMTQPRCDEVAAPEEAYAAVLNTIKQEISESEMNDILSLVK